MKNLELKIDAICLYLSYPRRSAFIRG